MMGFDNTQETRHDNVNMSRGIDRKEPSLEDFFSGNRMKRHFGIFHFQRGNDER